jgi:hypothetical protein
MTHACGKGFLRFDSVKKRIAEADIHSTLGGSIASLVRDG